MKHWLRSVRTRLRTEGGFSAVEISLATGVGILLLTASVVFNRQQLHTLTHQANQGSIQSSARNIAELFTRECRRADGLTLIPDIHGIRVRADLDRNGTIGDPSAGDSPEEDVVWALHDASVWRKSGGLEDDLPWERLLPDVDLANAELRFVGPGGVEISYTEAAALDEADFDELRRVVMQLDVSELRASLAGEHAAARIRAEVTLRKRFFLSSSPVDDAIGQDFDADAFVASMEGSG